MSKKPLIKSVLGLDQERKQERGLRTRKSVLLHFAQKIQRLATLNFGDTSMCRARGALNQSSPKCDPGLFKPVCAVLVLLPGACSAPGTSVAPRPPEPLVAAPEVPDPGEAEEFLDLIDTAERALTDDRLLTPADDNAYFYYKRALSMAPHHPAAGRGFERIVERYLQLAQLAIERQQWTRARSMLDRATVVDRNHTGIVAVRRQLEMLANAERRVLRLDRTVLRERNDAMAAELAEFGKHARPPNARVSIRAPSDADARWIYRQLGRSSGGVRIRGEIEIGLPPQVTVLLLLPPES